MFAHTNLILSLNFLLVSKMNLQLSCQVATDILLGVAMVVMMAMMMMMASRMMIIIITMMVSRMMIIIITMIRVRIGRIKVIMRMRIRTTVAITVKTAIQISEK